MEKKDLKVICFGEVLLDIFPDGKRIGGAPLNVASRLSASGIDSTIISRIGNDQNGRENLSFLQDRKVNTNYIQIDSSYPTGTVIVTLNKAGSATYEIEAPAAWESIEVNEDTIEAVKNSDAFIFGSLACRDEKSRSTLVGLLKYAQFKIFDVNLRPPYYSESVVKSLMMEADFVKFNDEELYEIAALLDSPYNSLEQNLNFISDKTFTKTICVTKGPHGAVLLHEGVLFNNSGYQIKVRDTVGAGDSFLASLLSLLLQQKDPQQAINYACAVGALVASKEGANPDLTYEEIKNFMAPENPE